MKKNILIYILSSILLVGCGATPSTNNSIPTTTSSATSSTISSSVNEENFKVILPNNLVGVNVEVSNMTPRASEEVELYITANAGRRVDTVEMNGNKLIGQETNVKDCKIYRFIMPSLQDASITIVAVDVYQVSISTKLEGKFALNGIGDGFFAKGETVNFAPTTYAGYYYKDVVSLNDDVNLTLGNDGTYSFTMPDHFVTISATIDKNVYLVTHDEDDENYSLTINNNFPAEYDSLVSFKVSIDKPDIIINEVRMSGKTLTPSATGGYSFRMPAYPVEIEVDYYGIFKQISIEDSERFTADLTTIIVGSSSEVSVTETNVKSNQQIFVTPRNKNLEDNDYVVESIEVYGSNNSTSINNKLELDISFSEGRYGFVTPEEYRYLKIKLNERQSAGYPAGSYQSVNLSNDNVSAKTLSADGVLTHKSWGTDYNSPLKNLGENCYSYQYESYGYTYTIEMFVHPNKNAILEYDVTNAAISEGVVTNTQYAYSSTYMMIKDSDYTSDYYGIVLREYDNGSYIHYKQFYSFTRSDNSVLTCYFDFVTRQIYWDVTLSILEGNDGKTKDDIVEIKTKEGASLDKMKLESFTRGKSQYYANLID